jgi:hypothetical protein
MFTEKLLSVGLVSSAVKMVVERAALLGSATSPLGERAVSVMKLVSAVKKVEPAAEARRVSALRAAMSTAVSLIVAMVLETRPVAELTAPVSRRDTLELVLDD